MTDFCITIHGSGYDISPINGQEVGGFYVVVSVSADNASEACSIALDKLTRSEAFQEMISLSQGELSISDCQVDLERDLRGPEISGYVFYPRESAEKAEE